MIPREQYKNVSELQDGTLVVPAGPFEINVLYSNAQAFAHPKGSTGYLSLIPKDFQMYIDPELTGEPLREARQHLQQFNDPSAIHGIRQLISEIILFYSQIRDRREVITIPSGRKSDFGTANDKYLVNLYHFFQANTFDSVSTLHAKVLLGHEVKPRDDSLEQRLIKLVQIANGVRNFL